MQPTGCEGEAISIHSNLCNYELSLWDVYSSEKEEEYGHPDRTEIDGVGIIVDSGAWQT